MKCKLKDLEVKSFVTSLEKVGRDVATIKGGLEFNLGAVGGTNGGRGCITSPLICDTIPEVCNTAFHPCEFEVKTDAVVAITNG